MDDFIIDNKAIRLDQAKSSNQEEDVANYDLVNVRRVYFSEDNQLEKNIKKNVQNKVRTQRYTILTWAPLSLIFQFKRVSNIYFLLISVLTFLPFSPKNPTSMIGTFVLVLVFTMLKEAYEDYQRYKQDKEVNNKKSTVFNPNTRCWEERKWENVVAGNIIKFKKDEEVPADIVILYSSNNSGVVYIDTMNLDGETNLKEKQALLENQYLDSFRGVNGELRCEIPNENLEKWDAQLYFQRNPIIANIKNLLLRGCFVRNTDFGIGIVVYTGMETKIMKNLKKQPHKVSNMMKMMNNMLYTVFIFQIILITIFAGLNIKWTQDQGSQHSYLNINTSGTTQQEYVGKYFIQLLVFWVAYSHMIPISLYVIIEILKLGQASYINKDLKMYDIETESFARCRNSDLIEELGQIEMVFSDKTGTLTQNKMVFKKCQINGLKFGDPYRKEVNLFKLIQNSQAENPNGMVNSGIKDIQDHIIYEDENENSDAEYPYITQFFMHLALCNTVVCDTSQKNIVTYKASSPDELALVQGANMIGIRQEGREHNRITICNLITEERQQFTICAEFPFDSNRKRMSVIIRDSNGKYKLLTKGADSMMIPRIDFQKNGIDSIYEIVDEDLYQYSCEGLRTLVIAERSMSIKEFNQFQKIYNRLQQSNHPMKEEKLLQLYDKVEQKLRYLGCTAIEDKLQDGVPLTIAKLMQADIRFFMLTGDKLETATEIAKSCQIIQDDMNEYVFNTSDKYRLTKSFNKLLLELNVNADENVKNLKEVQLYNQVLTIEGSCLATVISDEELSNQFFHLAIRSRSVVCCRMSPKQKADVVHIFKSRGNWITLAIGDGANDVSMIMEAHIGVGIKGKEGTQAVRSADFAISQFHFLLRLILYQGRTGYLRVSSMICYYFYKNVVCVFTEFYFAIWSGFSGQIYFLDWLPMLYNAIFTSWHCLFAMMLEKDANENYSFKYPQIYKSGQLRKHFNYRVFWKWIYYALWHGAACYFLPFIMSNVAINADGQHAEHWFYSTISFTIIIQLVFYKLLLETRHFNSITFFLGILSLVLYYGTLLLAQIADISYIFQPQILGLVQQFVASPNFWLLIIGGPFVCLVPDFFFKLITMVFYPTPIDKVMVEQKKYPDYDFGEDFNYLSEQIDNHRVKNSGDKEERKSLIQLKQTSFRSSKQKQEKSSNSSQVSNQNQKDRSTLSKIQERTNEVDVEIKTKKKDNNKKRKPRKVAQPIHNDDVQTPEDEIRGKNQKRQYDSQNSDGYTSQDSSSENTSHQESKTSDSDFSHNNSHDGNDMKFDKQSKLKQAYPQLDHQKGNRLSKNNKKKVKKRKNSSEGNDESNQPSIRNVNDSIRSDRNLLEQQQKEFENRRKSKKLSNKINRDEKRKSSKQHKDDRSMFYVSEAPSEIAKKQNENQQYLDYFEGFNKEIKSRTPKNLLEKRNYPKRQQKPLKISQNNGRGLENNKSQEINDSGILEEYKQPRDIKSSQVASRADSKFQNQQQKAGEDKSLLNNVDKNVQDVKASNPSSIDDIKTKGSEEDAKKSDNTKLPYVNVKKDAFTKIFANRTVNAFIVQKNNDIPKSKITKPKNIIDGLSYFHPEQQQKSQENNEVIDEDLGNNEIVVIGHRLEKSVLKTPFDDISGTQSAAAYNLSAQKRQKKKYVQKYKNAY